MAFKLPTLRELIKQMTEDAEREAGSAQLRMSNLRVLPKVFSFGVYGVSQIGFIGGGAGIRFGELDLRFDADEAAHGLANGFVEIEQKGISLFEKGT